MVPRDPGAQAKTALQIRLTGGRPIPGSGPAAGDVPTAVENVR